MKFQLLTGLLVVLVLLPQTLKSQAADHAAQANASQSDSATPAENPPQILVAASIDEEGNLKLVRFETIHIGFQGEFYNHRTVRNVSLKDVLISTVDGQTLTIPQARKRIAGKDTPILVSDFQRPLANFYQAMFSSDTLHFVFPKRSPRWQEVEVPGGAIKHTAKR